MSETRWTKTFLTLIQMASTDGENEWLTGYGCWRVLCCACLPCIHSSTEEAHG